MSAVAFVPVRGGSKGIPDKNIRPFCGRPLVAWILHALEAAQRVQRVVVSTDCERIASVVRALRLGKVEVFHRSAATATDTASTESAMLEFLAADSIADETPFVLVQATSPFTRAADIDTALARFDAEPCDSMLSVARVRRFFWSDDGMPLNYEPRHRPRRQDFAGSLIENGAFYINRAGTVRRYRNRLHGDVLPHEMAEHSVLELDEPDDWLIGEALMRRHGGVTQLPPPKLALVLTDVDGVLTDGGMYYGNSGEESKRFNTLDGMAFELARNAGLRTGIVTGESTDLVARRAAKIGADFVYQGIRDKLPVVERLCAELGIGLQQVAYVGDDLGDLEVLRAVGLAACPSTAVAAVRDVVHYVCERAGGQGCLREVVDRFVMPTALAEAASHNDQLRAVAR